MIKSELRKQVVDLTVGCCAYCGRSVATHGVIEHKIPERRGGVTELQNLALSCYSCNNRKGPMTVEEFRESLGRQAVERLRHAETCLTLYGCGPNTKHALSGIRRAIREIEAHGFKFAHEDVLFVDGTCITTNDRNNRIYNSRRSVTVIRENDAASPGVPPMLR